MNNNLDNYMITYNNCLSIINNKINKYTRVVDQYDYNYNVLLSADVINSLCFTLSVVGTMMYNLIDLGNKGLLMDCAYEMILPAVISYGLGKMFGIFLSELYVNKKLGMTYDELKEYLNNEFRDFADSNILLTREKEKLKHLEDEKGRVLNKVLTSNG